MIYDPLIDELAALPLQMLVTPADQQTEEGQLACWCPFCKTAPGSQSSGQQQKSTPTSLSTSVSVVVCMVSP